MIIGFCTYGIGHFDPTAPLFLCFLLHCCDLQAQANACGGACKTFQPNDADHEHGKINHSQR